MDEKTYLKDRIDDQIDYYDKKSIKQKRWFYFSRFLSICLAASIPVLTGIVLKYPIILRLISIIGGVIMVIDGFSSLTKVQEKWLDYRSITETLRHEKYMYLCHAGVYNISDKEDRFQQLVERAESIISQENINWANLNSKGNKNHDK